MSKAISFYLAYATLLVSAVAISVVSSDDGDVAQVVTRDAFAFTLPNPVGEVPLFSTNDQNGRFMSVHVPMIYDGELHFRGPGLMGTKFTADWFHGLLSFTYDKTPQADGELHGPVKLGMMWLTVYDNKE